MDRFTYTKDPQRLPKLHDALIAAGLAPLYVTASGGQIFLDYPAGTARAPVDAVVAAYDPTAPTAGETQASQDGVDLQAFAAAVAAQIVSTQSMLTTLGSPPSWATLTAAQQGQALQVLLQNQLRLLRALGVVVRRVGGL